MREKNVIHKTKERRLSKKNKVIITVLCGAEVVPYEEDEDNPTLYTQTDSRVTCKACLKKVEQ